MFAYNVQATYCFPLDANTYGSHFDPIVFYKYDSTCVYQFIYLFYFLLSILTAQWKLKRL
jgi:hypothetical protein